MIVYANTGDLTNTDPPWLDSVPVNAGTLLRAASVLVALAANRNLYTDAPTGTDTDVLRDATCAQVQAWVSLGVDPAKAGTDFPAPVKRAKVLTADIERDTSGALKAAQDAADGLCDLSRSILQSGGLLWVAVPLGDTQPYLYDYGLGVACLPGNDPAGTGWPFGIDNIDGLVDAEINRLFE